MYRSLFKLSVGMLAALSAVSSPLLSADCYSDCAQPLYDCCDSEPMQYDAKISYLYWGAYQDNMGYAVEVNAFSSPRTFPANGSLRSQKRAWGSGVRLEGFASTCSSNWRGHFGWTYFDTEGYGSASADPIDTTSLIVTNPPATASSLVIFASHAGSHWHLNYNQWCFDVEGRDLDVLNYCNRRIAVRPSFGIMAARIDQRQAINYRDFAFGTDIAFDIKVARSNKFWGIGPKFGACMDFALTDTLKLIGGTHVAFLFGKIHSKSHVHAPAQFLPGFLNFSRNVGTGRPTAGGTLGVEWLYNTCGYDISVSASYECQYYWSQWTNLSGFIDNVSSGSGKYSDLFLQGLTLSVGVGF